MSATVAIQGKGKKVGTPNYKNEVLLNLIEFYLPAGNEQWKIVAQRYQEVSKEAFLRYHDDIKRHFDIGPTNLSNSKPLRGNPWSTQKQ
jgi:hypothetical protein